MKKGGSGGFLSTTPTPGGKKNKFKGDLYSSGKGDVGKPGGPGGMNGKRMGKGSGKK
jgi:hypothetical protein